MNSSNKSPPPRPNPLGQYVLDRDGNPIPEPDLLKWGEFLAKGNRVLQQDSLPGDVFVSTVFLGIDHRFGHGPPLLWETAIFGGPHDQYQERYASRAAALRGHLKALILAKGNARAN